ncbi:HAD family hydrolase [Peribacillus sp. SCS-37]|uniref:HAD family hydrolase n=1 Tax=Paraperibacillus esterisolvens TaxID=3115296 RepID=UPI003905BB63
MKRSILFDLDGTLLDRDHSIYRFASEQYKRYQNHFSSITELEYRNSFIELDMRGYRWKDEVYRLLLDRHGISSTGPEELLNDYITNFHAYCTPFEGIYEALRKLKEKEYLLGLITNGRTQFQRQSIQALALEPYMDIILISEEAGMQKPDSRIFLKALEGLQVPAHCAIYTGDHPDNDIRAAANAGMAAIWKQNSGWDPFSHEYTFESYEELPKLADKIFGSLPHHSPSSYTSNK